MAVFAAHLELVLYNSTFTFPLTASDVLAQTARSAHAINESHAFSF